MGESPELQAVAEAVISAPAERVYRAIADLMFRRRTGETLHNKGQNTNNQPDWGPETTGRWWRSRNPGAYSPSRT